MFLLTKEENESRKGIMHTALRRKDIEKYLQQTNEMNSFLNSLGDFAQSDRKQEEKKINLTWKKSW